MNRFEASRKEPNMKDETPPPSNLPRRALCGLVAGAVAGVLLPAAPAEAAVVVGRRRPVAVIRRGPVVVVRPRRREVVVVR